MSYSWKSEKEGFCLGEVKQIADKVTVYCDKVKHGQLDRKAQQVMAVAKALLCRQAFINANFIPDPYTEGFKSLYVTSADQSHDILSGDYFRTEMMQGGKPIFQKTKQIGQVSHAWSTDDGKWVLGNWLDIGRHNSNKGYVKAKHSTPWLHYTHDFEMLVFRAENAIETIDVKIISYSVKDQERDQAMQDKEQAIDLAHSSDDETADGRPKRRRVQPAKASSSSTRAGGGADGAAGGSGFR
jgi:hypothetical protein